MVEIIAEEIPALPRAVKLSLNVGREMGEKIRILAFNLRLSESSIVEVALKLMIEARDDEEIEELLRANGACLRHKRVTSA